MARKGKATRVLISIIFIALGLGYVIDAILNLVDLDFQALFAIGCVLGVLMFVLGIMGISNAPLKTCRIVAVIVCVLAITSFVMTVFSFNLSAIIGGITTTFVWALLAWIYFEFFCFGTNDLTQMPNFSDSFFVYLSPDVKNLRTSYIFLIA